MTRRALYGLWAALIAIIVAGKIRARRINEEWIGGEREEWDFGPKALQSVPRGPFLPCWRCKRMHCTDTLCNLYPYQRHSESSDQSDPSQWAPNTGHLNNGVICVHGHPIGQSGGTNVGWCMLFPEEVEYMQRAKGKRLL